MRGPFDRFVYGRIWRTRFRLVERPVKLIGAVKRAENLGAMVGRGEERRGEIGAEILDLSIFESIIGNTANRETDRSRVSPV